MTGAPASWPAPAVWPAARVGALLAAVAVLLGLQELLRPDRTAHLGPLVLGVVTLAVAGLVVRHSRRLEPQAASTWRSFAHIGWLLALGQLIRGVTGAGVNPVAVGLSDLPLAATGPVAVLLCVRLVRATRGRLRHQVVLDAVVALMSLGVLVEVLERHVDSATRAANLMLTLGYPMVSAVLVAVGLVTFAGVSAPRRAAAGWLLLCFASLAVAMASGALAVGASLPVYDVATSTAYLAVLVTATLALAADPGPQAPDVATTTLPLVGVVVTHCLGFGVVLLLLAGWALGRPLLAAEATGLAVLMALTLVRTLVWAADGARLTRQVVRAESYFRTLVHRSADLTFVLDPQGRITWASTAGQDGTGWSTRDLEGRPLEHFVHPDDEGELDRALDPSADLDDGRGPVLRLRTRDGGWRQFQTVRAVSPAALPGAGAEVAPGGRILHLRDVEGRHSAEVELERLAYTDYLTGLPNRARFMAALETARAGVAEGRPVCLLLLDLDGFKPVNDIAGHDAGDSLLVQVAARLRRTVRARDLIGRLGGDEFAVLVRADVEEATALAERIVADLRSVRPSAPAEGTVSELIFDVSGSVGVTELSALDDVPAAFRQADLALRAAKAAGKSCVRRYGDAADEATRRRTRLAGDLPAAIAAGQFRLVYQPVVGVAERRVLGLEALVRWEHPTLGLVPPDEFIPLAEDDGLIVALQRWVLRTATTDLAGLLAAGIEVQMGVNVSVRHLQAGCLAPDVAQALAASGVPPQRLILEITESVMLDAEDRLEGDLRTLREMGCIISVDDFGRGYSSLAYLARLPVDILKMDREFIAHIETDPRGAALVASIVELGRTLAMDVVAEGVETPGQLAALTEMNCRFVQGYLLSRPVTGDQLPTVIGGTVPGVLARLDLADLDTGVHLVGRDG